MALPDPRDPVALARALIACPSVTPEEAGAVRLVREVLESLGFTVHWLEFGSAGRARIANLYARRGSDGPNLCFAGHTDVVPPGDAAAWAAPPFGAQIREGAILGRGAVDMKGAIAAFIAAVARAGALPGSVSLLITGDEEGESVDGTVRVVDWLEARGERIDACIVGEPTNQSVLGDMIKIGRRGSLTGRLTVHGTQGHAAYPHLADNPIPALLRILSALDAEVLDEGAPGFDASNLEITSVDVGNPASNVIPAAARAIFNVRFNVRHSGASLSDRLRSIVRAALDRPDRRAELDIQISGEPFLTEGSGIVDVLMAAVTEVTGRTPVLSTTGGTSDARFIKRIAPVVEFGLVGQTMHKIDEQVPLADLAQLTDIYGALLLRYLRNDAP